MRKMLLLFSLFLATSAWGAGPGELHERRQKAVAAFHDGILLLHANSRLELHANGFWQDPTFYYFTGLDNVPGAILAIDGPSGESWLFLPSDPPFSKVLPPELSATADTAKRLAIDHVLDWELLESFMAQHAKSPTKLYYRTSRFDMEEIPLHIAGGNLQGAPLWLSAIAARWPSYQLEDVTRTLYTIMAVQSPSELASVRAAAAATVRALQAGIRAIHPNVSQRSVEAAVENSCWTAGAHGPSFWPWAMTGENSVFPRPFASLLRYDHLNATLHPGELVRLDIGCEVDHYQGDLGRTIPVSGQFTGDQREVWNIFVAAYQAGVRSLRAGVTEQQVFAIWQAELLGHRDSAKSDLAKRAIASWSRRENIPYWELHTMNLDAGPIDGPLEPGTTIDFEPIASIDGQGFYLEDMFLVTREGVELLTPGLPYTAEQIEAVMH